MTIHVQDGVTVLDLGDMEIWDGADLALLRETLTQQIEGQRCKSIGVDMHSVKYIPSGFFGMLYDWYDKGIAIHLFRPQPNVGNMLWFRRFFSVSIDECYMLTSEEAELIPSDSGTTWVNGSSSNGKANSNNASAGKNGWRKKQVAHSMSAAVGD